MTQRGNFLNNQEVDIEGDSFSERRSARRTAGERSNELMLAYEREIRDEPTDTVREYLRSIGQHALLTAPEELDLGRDVERWMLLKETRKQLNEETGRDPGLHRDGGGVPAGYHPRHGAAENGGV